MPDRAPRTAKAAPPACFLCGKPVAGEDLEGAFERLRDDVVPSVREIAHPACAAEEGLLDGEEPDEEGLPRRGG